MSLPGIKLFDLSDRLSIITGGSKGLGFAMAAGLASAGSDIVLVSRTQSEAEKAASSLADEYGIQAIGMEGDVRNQQDMERVAMDTMDTFGRIDILINSAGINIRGPIDELSLDNFSEVMDINVTGTWLASRAVTPFMKEAMYGRIINISSTLGLVGVANRTPYASSKGAVVQMTRALALELAPHNIKVNAICPGPFLTQMNLPIANTEDGKKFIIGATALRRWGELEEIQGAAILLASDAASYMVGSLITVDGGWTAQ